MHRRHSFVFEQNEWKPYIVLYTEITYSKVESNFKPIIICEKFKNVDKLRRKVFVTVSRKYL